MRILVCGDRDWNDALLLNHDIETNIITVILEGFAQNGECHNVDSAEAMVVVEGAAHGADKAAGEWVRAYEPNTFCGCDVELQEYPADWNTYGKAAGPIRNQQMLDEGKPDVVLAFHDDLARSKGTADMVRRAKKASIPTYVVSRG